MYYMHFLISALTTIKKVNKIFHSSNECFKYFQGLIHDNADMSTTSKCWSASDSNASLDICSIRVKSMCGPRGCSRGTLISTRVHGGTAAEEEMFFFLSIFSSNVGQSKSRGCRCNVGGILILSTHFRYDASTAESRDMYRFVLNDFMLVKAHFG